MIGRLTGCLNGPLLPHFLALALRHVLGRIDDAAGLALFVSPGHHCGGTYPAVVVRGDIRLFRHLAVCKSHERLVFFQDLTQIPAAHGIEIIGPVLRIDESLRIGAKRRIIVRLIPENLSHILQLVHAPHLILLQISVISGKEHTA